MIPNPFIALGNDPVAFFGLLGYALITLLFIVGGASWSIRQSAHCITLASRNHRQKNWWGDAVGGWFPPTSWLLRFFSVLIALALSSWAVSALIWFVGGGA